ncbi:hypothetical protein SAMN05216570_1451 [Dyella sp. OK004]|uniref:XAC0095 family protein n=1 Tax=Dyella sp. OK004 TaxID=1855292 RepID=UPI0008F03095|nr:hypothetical protein [Dyella sp. OK004]SFS00670.1 hypothetical protein SAMN05216570_1451 [Dyella sp. OK004]
MVRTTRSSQPIAWHYVLPESAHHQLCEIRDALQQLADLAARSDPKAKPLKVDPKPAFACFGTFAGELTVVIDSCQWRWPG